MIQINLLPEELRQAKQTGYVLNANYVIYAALGLIGILLFLHLYLGIQGALLQGKLNILNSQLRSLEPQKKSLDLYRGSGLQSDSSAAWLNWSEKLNKLSLVLPAGIWFNEISLTPAGVFTLKGSVISMKNEQMNLIKKFIDSLKKENGFFADFSSFDLASTGIKTLGGYDVVEFTLSGQVKVK